MAKKSQFFSAFALTMPLWTPNLSLAQPAVEIFPVAAEAVLDDAPPVASPVPAAAVARPAVVAPAAVIELFGPEHPVAAAPQLPTAVVEPREDKTQQDTAIEQAVYDAQYGRMTGVQGVSTHASATESLAKTVLVRRGAEWRYWDTGEEAPANWTEVEFDATDDWSSGRTPIGYGQAGLATQISFGDDKDKKYAAAFFRHEFEVIAPIAKRPVLCQLQNDDAAIVYLNGKEVFRRNMPDGKATMETYALSSSKPESTYWTFVIPAEELRVGKNVFAIRVHQRSGDSSDLIHDFEATACSAKVAQIARRVQQRELLVYSDFKTRSRAIIPRGSTWRYQYGEETPDEWMKPDFDDSSWETGKAPLGFGESEAKTDLSQGKGKLHPAAHFRKSFKLSAEQSAKTLVGKFRFDDAAALYINGTELLRFHLPEGKLNATTGAAKKIANEDHFWTYVIEPQHLHPGKNVIAFSVHQFKDSTDLIGELFLRDVDEAAARIAFEIQSKEKGGNANTGVLANPNPKLIQRGSVWKYWDGGKVDKRWKTLDFDDSNWAEGEAPLGYGDSHIATNISYGDDGKNKHAAAYFRQKFEATEAARMHGLIGRVLHDDAVMVFLNGKEVYRRNVPVKAEKDDTYGSISAVSGAPETHYWTFAIDPGELQAGENVLAVRVQQSNKTSSDLSMDLELIIPNATQWIADRRLRDNEAVGRVVYVEQANAVEDRLVLNAGQAANKSRVSMIHCSDGEVNYSMQDGQLHTVVMDAVIQARQYQPNAIFARAMEGDTLQKIAAREKIEIEKLRILNRIEGAKVYKDREIYLKAWAYKASRSDTIAKIATRLNVPKVKLAKLNDLPVDAVLKNGQDLQVPGNFSHELNRHNSYLMLGMVQNMNQGLRPYNRSSLKNRKHTVKKGETIVELAKKYKTTEAFLRKMNALEEDEEPEGDRILIEYSVQPNKNATVQQLAISFNVTLEELLDLNDLVDENDFDSSKRIQIPFGKQMRMTQRATNQEGFPVYEVVLGSREFAKIKDKYAVPDNDLKKPATSLLNKLRSAVQGVADQIAE